MPSEHSPCLLGGRDTAVLEQLWEALIVSARGFENLWSLWSGYPFTHPFLAGRLTASSVPDTPLSSEDMARVWFLWTSALLRKMKDCLVNHMTAKLLSPSKGSFEA